MGGQTCWFAGYFDGHILGELANARHRMNVIQHTTTARSGTVKTGIRLQVTRISSTRFENVMTNTRFCDRADPISMRWTR